jgi:hypothetical protein
VTVLAACSVPQTAVVFHEPESAVTAEQQVAAWVAWNALQGGGSDSPVLACIRGHESRDYPNPWAVNTGNGYFGAYQWLPGSWNSAAGAVGRPDLIGRLPYEPVVSRADQDSVTLAYHNMVGDGPWGNRC